MAKDKQSVKAAKAAPAPAEDADKLRDEVKAFAAQLGLSTGSAAAFDAFDDFAPEKAKQQIGKGDSGQQAPPKQQQRCKKGELVQEKDRGQPGGKGGKQQRDAASSADGGRSGAGSGAAAAQPPKKKLTPEEEKEEAIRTRTWKQSVGPRPGEQAVVRACGTWCSGCCPHATP